MKNIFTLLALVVTSIGYSQNFQTSIASATYHKASYFGAPSSGVILDNGIFIHQKDVVEIIDLHSNKIIFNWDPAGKYGQTWISQDGKFAGNYSQNAKAPDGQYRDIFQVLDINTKKVYSKFIPAGYWNKGAFGPANNEVVVNAYDSDKDQSSILLFDFIKGTPIKTYFSTTKFSTVIMALAFSKDGSKIYAGIAENAVNSYFAVYDKNSGSLLKKVKLSYQMDKVYVTDDYIFVSGANGNSGDPYTTKLSSSDYSKKGEWKFSMLNIDPTGSYALSIEYKSNVLSKYDLNTGKKTDLINVAKLGELEWVSGISTNNKYFFTSIKRKGKLTEQGGSNAFVVFKNELFEESEEGNSNSDNTTNNNVTAVTTVVDDKVNTDWLEYVSKKPVFKINFPSSPVVTDGQTSKGKFKQTLKNSSKNTVYMINLVELASGVKKSKYLGLSEKMADGFVKKIAPDKSDKSEFTLEGQQGIEYTFTKKKVFYRYRSICLNGIAYQLIYLNSDVNGAVGKDFYDSFMTEF